MPEEIPEASVNFPVGIHVTVTVLHYFLTHKNHIVVITKLFYRATNYWAVTLKSDNKIVTLNFVINTKNSSFY